MANGGPRPRLAAAKDRFAHVEVRLPCSRPHSVAVNGAMIGVKLDGSHVASTDTSGADAPTGSAGPLMETLRT